MKWTIIICVAMVLLAFERFAIASISDHSPIAHWAIDGDATDISGNGNHGTVHGASLIEDRFGIANSAYALDGVNDYIDIGSGIRPSWGFTVSMWFKDGDLGEAGVMFRNDSVDDGGNRYGFMILHRNYDIVLQLFEGYSVSSNRRTYHLTDDEITDTDWHHLAVVVSGINDIDFYFDTVHSEAYQSSGTGTGMQYSSSGHGAIGHWINRVTSVPSYCDGAFDDIRVYQAELDSDEIQELYTIPEPATLSLLAIGGLALLRKRK